MRKTALIGIVFLLTSASSGASQEKWTPWVELGGFYGSNDTSRGEAVLWVPFAQSQTSVLFGEARGKLFEDDMREGNFALGYRKMQASGWNLGLWGGYDIRRSEFGNTFHQLAGGIEALSDRWDVRANAYLPLNDSDNLFRASSFVTTGPALEFTGSTIGLVTTTTTTTISQDELALWGFDAEIGAKIFSTPLDLSGPHHEFRIYAGAYHFDHSDLPNSVTGPRVRAEWRMDDVIDQWAGSRLTLEAEYSHDQLRDDRVEVGARLRLPFGDSVSRVASRSLTAQERRMADGLERDTDIVTDTKTTSSSTSSTATEAVEDAETGVRFDRVATVDSTGDLTAVSSTAGANSLIIADGSAGNLVGEFTMQGAQTLLGGGGTIEVRGVASGTVLAFTADGSRPIFEPSAGAVYNSAALWMAGNDSRVSGIDIAGSTSSAGTIVHGIRLADGVTNARIDNVDIRTLTGSGIRIGDNASGVTVGNASFSDIGRVLGNVYGAISVGYEARDVTLTDLEIDSTYAGIYFINRSEATLSNVRINGANGSGVALSIWVGATVAFTDVTVSGTFDDTINSLGGSILEIRAGANVTGTGNTVAAGTTYTDSFCDGSSWTGSFEFDGTTYGPGDC